MDENNLEDRLKELEAQNRLLTQENTAQKKILKHLNTINDWISQSENIDNMLDLVLEELLNIFDCDRAWLLFPCDPHTLSWKVPREKTRAKWPGALAINVDFPMSDDVAQVFSMALSSKSPLPFYTKDMPPEAAEVNKAFHVKSQLILALRPHLGSPWLLGIHHCEKEREYKQIDLELFRTLAHRIEDGLSTYLSWQKTQESELLQRAILDNTPSLISLKNLRGEYLLTNKQFQKVLGKSASDITRQKDENLFPNSLANELSYRDSQVVAEEKAIEFEEKLPSPRGFKSYISVKFPLRDENNKMYAIGNISTDITERLKAEEQIAQLAFFDYLTKLPNRRMLYEKLDHSLFLSKEKNIYGSLIFIDLDDFKTLNDTKGHIYGDKLLLETATRLKQTINAVDLVARLGGDEFMILLPNLGKDKAKAKEQANEMGKKVLKTLRTVFTSEKYQHHVTASVGVCLFNGNSISKDELLKRVDAAMYTAKKLGRNNMQFFNPQIQDELEYKANLSSHLRVALKEKQFYLHYQPQLNEQNQVTGAEALIRWSHPELGFVSPGEFIPIAEETAFIIKLGTWVLEEGCKLLHEWSKDSSLKELTLSVNVSAKQFKDTRFVDIVDALCHKWEINPSKLKLEITESFLVEHIQENIATMNALKEKGIYLSMDDFGTGYSSLSYLRNLPLDQLKIDRTFVKDIQADEQGELIVKTIIGMANNLKMNVIAEGVETKPQKDFLLANGCSCYQGYYFSKPVSREKFEEYALKQNAVTVSNRST